MSVNNYDVEHVRASAICRRRARVEHQCEACDTTIRRGDVYELLSGINHDRRPFRHQRCLRCSEMSSLLNELLPGDESCEWTLNCGHDWDERFDGPPPDALVELAFLSPEEAQKRFADKPARRERFVLG